MEVLAQGTEEIASKQAESSSLSYTDSPSNDIDIKVPQVVVTWADADENTRLLFHHRTKDPARQVTFRISYNISDKTTFFQVQVPIQLKTTPLTITTLLLNIPPEAITALTVRCSDEPHQTVREQLGPSPTCLGFQLQRPPDLVVPRGPLVPRRQREHGDKLDNLKLLSQAISLDVHFATGIVQDDAARTICDLASSPMARSVAQYADLGSLYAGKGGTVLTAQSPLCPPTVFPPSYTEAQATPPPPPPPEKVGPSSSHPSRKRPRKISFQEGDDIEAICARVFEDKLALHMESLREELRYMKRDLMDHIERQISDTHPLSNIYNKEEIDDLIQETRNDSETYTDDTINDRLVDIKVDLQDYTNDQLRDTEERLMTRLKSMSWVMNTEDA